MSITLDEAKAKGRRVAQRLQTFGYPVSNSQALEVVATVYGDENWQAMRHRLGATDKPTKPRAKRLRVYTVALYRAHEDDDEDFVAKASVLCFNQRQAREAVFEEYWHPQYDNAGYRATYETDVDDFEGIPDVDMLVEWLANLASRPYSGPEELADMLWRALTNMGARPVEGDARYDPAAILQALHEAAATLPSAADLFRGLYAELPEGMFFMASLEGDFAGVDETLKFAAKR